MKKFKILNEEKIPGKISFIIWDVEGTCSERDTPNLKIIDWILKLAKKGVFSTFITGRDEYWLKKCLISAIEIGSVARHEEVYLLLKICPSYRFKKRLYLLIFPGFRRTHRKLALDRRFCLRDVGGFLGTEKFGILRPEEVGSQGYHDKDPTHDR